VADQHVTPRSAFEKLGFWFQQDLLEVIGSMKLILTKGLSWSQEQAEVFFGECQEGC
jgi:hypothetical protein